LYFKGELDVMDDNAALEDICNGGQAGYAVLRCYEDTLRSHLVEKYYVSAKEMHHIVQETFANIPRLKRRRCKGRLRNYLIKNEVVPKKSANGIAQQTFIELEPNINDFKQRQYEARLHEILMTEYEVPEAVADKVAKWTFSLQKLNISDWLKRSAESVADAMIVKNICNGNQSRKYEGVLYKRHVRSLMQNIGYKYKVPSKYRVPPEDLKDRLDHWIYEVLQNTFTNAFGQLHTFKEEESSFATWLYFIGYTEVANYWRKQEKQSRLQKELKKIQQHLMNYKVTENQDDEASKTQDATVSDGTQLDTAKDNDVNIQNDVKLDNDIFELLLANKATNDRDDKICLEQIKVKLEREGNTGLLSCLQAFFWQKSEGFSIEQISAKIGRSYEATKTYLFNCKKRLRNGHEINSLFEINNLVL